MTYHNNNIVTRFAPSPTGNVHIGNIRAAIFNWLFARHNGGKFLLRIEDTDRARSTQAAVDAIFDGLQWLGLDWDAEPVFQFSRAPRHAEVAHKLLSEGKAYLCFCSQEELERDREENRQRREAFVAKIRATPAAQLIFLDESGVTTSMTRLYARRPDGRRVHEATPGGHWKSMTILAAMRLRGITAAMTIEEATDGDIFLAYVEHVLCPTLVAGTSW